MTGTIVIGGPLSPEKALAVRRYERALARSKRNRPRVKPHGRHNGKARRRG
jgi:hypothetical protein